MTHSTPAVPNHLDTRCALPLPVTELRLPNSPSESADEALLERLLDDEPAAWREFNLRYAALLHRSISRVMRRFASVVDTDAVAEVYATLCVQLLADDKSKLRRFQPERGNKLSSWLGMLATHAAYDHLRTLRRSPRGDGEDEAAALPCVTPDAFEVCAAREQAAQVSQLLESFTVRDRELVMLYYGEGLPPEEIARRMQISIKTVYSKKHKLQARLEALLGKQRLAA